ncbi:MAG TPA: FAD-binding oxidoreductase [Polyangia bacterium]|jgi:glycolate oxidase FAD binding subunit|nr:FAD-binding oxidoreductase [Polyangia bacterium]
MTIETPTNEADLAEIVQTAGQGGVALVTEGNGTKRAFGPAPSPRARRVSLRGLAGVTHEAADMILSVDAGARLADVQAQLARAEQWLPLDPPFAGAGATIGGVLATNASGPRRLGYGTSKDLLLGLRVVGAHGRVTKSGGRVVKNVSGYDLHRPQVGAFGTLGVIVRAHFKVCARPEVSALWALPCATLNEAHALLLQIDATALRPVALEALDAEDARLAMLPATPAVAVVGVEGSRASFERHARELASYAVRGVAAPMLVEGAAAAALWTGLAELPARHGDDVRVRVGARPHDLPALLGALELSRVPVRGVTVRAATGLAYVALAPTGDARPIAALVDRWRRLASARAGYAVVESAPLDLPERALLPFGEAAPSGVAAALRRAWDPLETLNAGRMAW